MIYLDCRDGTLEAAFVLIDTLDLMQAPTRTHALGEVGGTAIGVLVAGRQRIAAPNARFHLSEPRTQVNGNANQLVARAEQHRVLLRKFRTRVADATGRSVSQVGEDLIQGSHVPKAFIF